MVVNGDLAKVVNGNQCQRLCPDFNILLRYHSGSEGYKRIRENPHTVREYRELMRSRVAGYELRYVRSVLWRDVVAYIL